MTLSDLPGHSPTARSRQLIGDPGPANLMRSHGGVVGAVVLCTSESGNALLGPNKCQTCQIAKCGLRCQNQRRMETG